MARFKSGQLFLYMHSDLLSGHFFNQKSDELVFLTVIVILLIIFN